MVELSRIDQALLKVECARGRQRLTDEAREREHAEAVAHLAEGITTGDGARAFMGHQINSQLATCNSQR
jgi:hypothetical protein